MIEERSESKFCSIKLLRSPNAINSVSTIFSPINVPTIFASSQGIPIVQAIGLNINPRISCNDVFAYPKIKLTIATIEIKAINIAATLAANFNPSVAPFPSASIAFELVFSI